MKRILFLLAGLLGLFALVAVGFLFLWPRPADTTDPRIFAEGPHEIDYCDLPVLDGNGARALDIPKAYTPHCGWDSFPLPVLADCHEPLAPGVVDMRGLWLAETGMPGHVERIEQCGDRTVITSTGIIHDFHTDGTLANGSRDIEPPHCVNTLVSISFTEDGTMAFHPFGLPMTIVTRRMEGDQLIWTYPRVEEEVRMKRICRLPDGDLSQPLASD